MTGSPTSAVSCFPKVAAQAGSNASPARHGTRIKATIRVRDFGIGIPNFRLNSRYFLYAGRAKMHGPVGRDFVGLEFLVESHQLPPGLSLTTPNNHK